MIDENIILREGIKLIETDYADSYLSHKIYVITGFVYGLAKKPDIILEHINCKEGELSQNGEYQDRDVRKNCSILDYAPSLEKFEEYYDSKQLNK